ncbi:unnamed protein product, partial [Choristocarpus tenellus]
SDEDQGSWRPSREGQGSWNKGEDKKRSKGKEKSKPTWRVELARGLCTADVEISQPLGLDLVDGPNNVVLVSTVHRGGSADQMGIRAGDRVVASSATLGKGLWEKKSVDGVLSAVRTRLLFSDSVTLRLERELGPEQTANAR